MKNLHVVEEILNGKLNSDRGSLDFSCPRVELSVQKDSSVEGTFRVYGPVGKTTEGYVLSSDLRMECITEEFGGSEDEILYRFHAQGMEGGEECKGTFQIISNQGEYSLPFSVNVIADTLTSSLGNIKNLFHFTNLAKSNWDEAVKLFYSGNFKSIFTGNDRQYLAVYKGLSTVLGNERNVEEFLLVINKKKAVEFIPEETKIKIEDPLVNNRYALVINRNGWGYTRLTVRTEGDFLRTDAAQVFGDDFLGNIYRLYYYIDVEKLHAGNNYGRIILCRDEGEIEIPVLVAKRTGNRRTKGIRREQKQLMVALMEYYQAYRLKKISTTTWKTETEKLLSRMQELDAGDLPSRLFQAQLLLAEERNNEAKWMIEKQETEVLPLQDSRPALFCYYLYLTTLYSKDERYIDDATGMIEGIYERNRGDWRIAWLLLYLSDRYTASASGKWSLLEEVFRYHCTSPVIYLEAWHMLCMNPAMLLKLDTFEIQVLEFAVKNDLMTSEILLQTVYLAKKAKEFSGPLFKILEGCYEKMPQEDVLNAICGLLIKGDKRGEKYFKWYRMGVDVNLRITRLYEYYMLSLPAGFEEKLPKIILMYFSYQCDLPYDKTAFLYTYIYRNREELPEIYISYAPAMERFVLEQIRNGRINEDLAYLYRHVLSLPLIDEECAKKLVRLLFMQELTIQSEQIKEAIVVYPFVRGEQVCPVMDGKAQVPLYASEGAVLLGDGTGNRYVVSASWEQKKLLNPARLSLMIGTFVREEPGYQVYVCYEYQNVLAVHEENVDLFGYLGQAEWMEESERRKIRMMLIRFLYEKDRMRELDEFLTGLKPDMANAVDRKEIVQYLVVRGLYEEAMMWVRSCGPQGMDAKTLARLCSRMLHTDMVEDRTMTAILYYCLERGKYDENILNYLIKYFEGSMKDMRDVWKAAQSFGLETYPLSERMLRQMLYSGAYVGEKTEILESYEKGGGREELISAFLMQCCYDYAVKERLTDSYILESVGRVYGREEQTPLVCEIAYLQYFAENKEERTPENQKICTRFLKDLLARKIVLPLYQEYQGYLPQLYEYMDKTILEYRVKPGNRAVIHYVIHGEENADKEYCQEEMKDMYAGICVKEFILFFGESLQYYITEGEEGKEQLTQSSTIQKSDMGQESMEGRYLVLNDIMVGKTLQDYNTMDTLLQEYYRQDFVTGKLFTIR